MTRSAKPMLSVSGLMWCVLFVSFSSLAFGKCSADKIRHLGDKGKSSEEIAEICHMSQDKVEEILDQDDSGDDEGGGGGGNGGKPQSNNGLPSGAPLGQCGCWGLPPNEVPAPKCASGRAVPRMCGGACSLGGNAWVGVCE